MPIRLTFKLDDSELYESSDRVLQATKAKGAKFAPQRELIEIADMERMRLKFGAHLENHFTSFVY